MSYESVLFGQRDFSAAAFRPLDALLALERPELFGSAFGRNRDREIRARFRFPGFRECLRHPPTFTTVDWVSFIDRPAAGLEPAPFFCSGSLDPHFEIGSARRAFRPGVVFPSFAPAVPEFLRRIGCGVVSTNVVSPIVEGIVRREFVFLDFILCRSFFFDD